MSRVASRCAFARARASPRRRRAAAAAATRALSSSSSSSSSFASIATRADVALARRAAQSAMRVIIDAAPVSIARVKRDRTVATTADVAAQVVCREALGDAGAAFVGEETRDATLTTMREVSRAASKALERELSDDDARAALEECDGILRASTYWCCDPLDGTKAFVDEADSGKQYVFGLARVDGARGDADLAVMIAPKWAWRDGGRGVELIAVRDGGCFARRLDAADDAFTRVRVGQPSDLRDGSARAVISMHETWNDLPLGRAGVRPKSVTSMCCGSLCKYVAVALGEVDIFIQHPKCGVEYVNAWDHAAGVLCCQEAGAIVSDCHGGALDMRGPDEERRRRFAPAGGGVVVASAGIHAEVVRAYRAGLEISN